MNAIARHAMARAASREPSTRPTEIGSLGFGLGAQDEPGGLRLLAGGGVLVDRVSSGGAIEQHRQAAVGISHRLGLAGLDRLVEAAKQRLDLRAVAQVLEALARRQPDPLLLLL